MCSNNPWCSRLVTVALVCFDVHGFAALGMYPWVGNPLLGSDVPAAIADVPQSWARTWRGLDWLWKRSVAPTRNPKDRYTVPNVTTESAGRHPSDMQWCRTLHRV